MNPVILEFENVWKSYSKKEEVALQDITFRVTENEHVGIIGANGSGKTTLFRLILNLILPDRGTIRILGNDELEESKKYIGFVPEHQKGLESFTPEELLTFAARMHNLPPAQINKRVTELLEWVGLSSHRRELLESFSKGMIQRLQLAVSLIHEPKILLMDEPMSGLDPNGQKDLRTLLQRLNGYTLLYASHNLREVEDLCDRIIILHQGRLVSDIAVSDQNQEIFTIESSAEIVEIIASFPGVRIREKYPQGKQVKIEIVAPSSEIQKIMRECENRNIVISRIKSHTVLEELYEQYLPHPKD
ncbi:MAG: hypothetical protein Kow0042_11970 [Calditrichia bacterium]